MNRVDPSGQDWWNLVNLGYTVASGVYEAVDTALHNIGGSLGAAWEDLQDAVSDIWNNTWDAVWSGDSCYEAPAPPSPPPPERVYAYTASVNINDPGYPTISSYGTHGNYNVETINFEDYAIDQGLLYGDHDYNCAYYLGRYPEGKYNTYVNETWTDKGQLLENYAVTGFAPSPGLIKRVPWLGFAWTTATAPQLHEKRTLKEYCGSGHRAHF